MSGYLDDHWSVEISLFTFDGLGNNIVGYMEGAPINPKITYLRKYLLDFWNDHLWNQLPDGHRADVEVFVRDVWGDIFMKVCVGGSAAKIFKEFKGLQL